MADQNDVVRELASVRRDLEDLEDEVDTATGAMPRNTRLAQAGRRNFEAVLKRLENIEEMAADTAEKLRAALKKMED